MKRTLRQSHWLSMPYRGIKKIHRILPPYSLKDPLMLRIFWFWIPFSPKHSLLVFLASFASTRHQDYPPSPKNSSEYMKR
ncbi:hypothetical protein P152DRAFT_299899 [Eremomyces bilateralis CBS 781.70]|uniref:Uncharacterized protein n=1 Tax=Eremomyces bilateralis CBS 781.70 TaxID=1392243 RepID=A0A6G1G7F6_9PEZI|nr:uncharacterized protein P152DRAFT_299899 [Eremomyces bilateralis CBS 781.70]KAF1813983.1 hypothetical protein P152DRAFT_299899 [Eremomyces bilateralis CBS 781.70]